MKKILVFPLLQMPSGHHHAADALMSNLRNSSFEFSYVKIDILNAFSPLLEKTISSLYLYSIKHFPGVYEFIYRFFANSNQDNSIKYLYKLLFLKKMNRIIEKEKPDLLICTHSFPSFLISELKKQGKIKVPLINVYTDFFMNKVWAGKGVDYHFAADDMAKKELVKKGIPEEKIFVTGIPVDRVFLSKQVSLRKKGDPFRVIVSGGSGGLGQINDLVLRLKNEDRELSFFVLCGNNKELYEKIRLMNDPKIRAFTYIESKKKMNDLYNQADAIILKPGGVTVSEALVKNLPIFVYSSLPGQETINLKFLESEGLVFELDLQKLLSGQLLEALTDDQKIESLKERFRNYLNDREDTSEIIMKILANNIEKGCELTWTEKNLSVK